MAPFSLCSKCKSRTRKIVKDRKTFKNIYLCPTCCKSKPEQQTPKAPAQQQQQQPKFGMEEQSKRFELPATMSPAATAESANLATQPTVAAPTGNCNESGNSNGNSNSSKQKSIPPVMQTVVINGRKYLAISETASDS